MTVEDFRKSPAEFAAEALRSTRNALRRAATFYVDLNEQAASRMFDAGEQIAARLEATPLYPIIEFQQTYARKAFEYWLRGARLTVERI
jgi:hypothetical protein